MSFSRDLDTFTSGHIALPAAPCKIQGTKHCLRYEDTIFLVPRMNGRLAIDGGEIIIDSYPAYDSGIFMGRRIELRVIRVETGPVVTLYFYSSDFGLQAITRMLGSDVGTFFLNGKCGLGAESPSCVQ